ncbi:lipopolysaccharide biosynthesis protein [Calothrix rhizosoleniae]|uniref:lipopolysaccharide biosynthesis protein n=1 Tax=Calothrix rhizosoleniae TaxID=888997 RepID=UPI000B4A1195|nr:oligosaccharide flippase family protein [Calothrix rhizosoleniae]
MSQRWFADRIFHRILKNFSWLLAAQVFIVIANFGYLSLTAHSLGVEFFGRLVLVRTYIAVIVGLTSFQSWQALIRYGAIFLQKKDIKALQNLIKLTTLLDGLGSLAGLAIAMIAAPYIGLFLGWNETAIREVQYLSIFILFTIGSTPTGLLRLYNRFDLLGLQQTIAPFIRLLGTVITIWLQAPLWGYFLVWSMAEALNGLSLLLLGWREVGKHGLLKDMDFSCPKLTQIEPKIWQFCLISNVNSSLPLTIILTPLMIGFLVNPIAVGLYRAGYELSTPLKDLALLLTQSVYPELAHLGSQENWKKFATIILRLGIILQGIGIVLFIIFMILGRELLHYSMGETFIPAYNTLIILVMAGIFKMGNFLLEPALYAMGLPHVSLRVNAIAILVVYLPLLMILTFQFGAVGAGLAMLLSNVLSFVLNSRLTWRQLRVKCGNKQGV